MYEEFFKLMKESKTSDKTQRRKYIRTQCKHCKCIIEYDSRRHKNHSGYCTSCRHFARANHIKDDELFVIRKDGTRVRGVILKCIRCGHETIGAKCHKKDFNGYCNSCSKSIDVKSKSKEEIQEYIKKNTDIDPITGCWIWKKYKDKDGYGSATVNTIIYKTHRLSYSVFIQSIEKGDFLLHSCHRRECCNPSHLRVGNVQMNSDDMKNANRQLKGERNKASKLIDDDIREIRKSHANGEKSDDLANTYGVCVTTINRIISGKCWSHVP